MDDGDGATNGYGEIVEDKGGQMEYLFVPDICLESPLNLTSPM